MDTWLFMDHFLFGTLLLDFVKDYYYFMHYVGFYRIFNLNCGCSGIY